MVALKYDVILGELRESDSSITYEGSSQYLSSINKTGLNCSGNDGDINRVLTVANAIVINVGQNTLHPNIDYTILGNDITFLINIFNDMPITIWYNTPPTYSNKTGADCSGIDGNTGRELAGTSVRLIVVDNKLLHPTIDYTTTNTTIHFLISLFNDMKITVWSW